MSRFHLLIASLACLAVAATAAATPYQGETHGRQELFAQRQEMPPSWAIGNWVGHNDYRHNDVELQIGQDGRTMMTFRVGRNAQTLRGSYRSGNLEFGGDRYQIRAMGEDLGLTKESDRRDFVRLRQIAVGRHEDDLNVDQPRNNEKVSSRDVILAGNSSYHDVQIEVFRGRDRVFTNTVPTRGGRFEARTNLPNGRYDATFRGREPGRTGVERHITFTVGGQGLTIIDSPRAGERLQSGQVTITGTSDSSTVDVEITRGFDRVFMEQVSVRDGRFTSRTSLGWGTYVVKVSGRGDNSVDKRGFEVLGRAGDNGRPQELRLDRPANRDRVNGDSITFEGSAPWDADSVRIEIRQGRNQVFSQNVDVRDGRFRTKAQLVRGHYDVTITAQRRGQRISDKRISFDVDR